MAAIAAVLEDRTVVAQVRRSRAREGRGPVVTCRSPGALVHVVHVRVVDAILLGEQAARQVDVADLSARFPLLPVLVFVPVRSDHAEWLLTLQRSGVRGVLVKGVDDAAVGDLLARQSVSAQLRAALRAAPRCLRLTDGVQLRIWDEILARPEAAVRVSDLGARLDCTREHLTRQFGAGGAPTLKRVIDFSRIALAALLLGNPGYGSSQVARLLHFTSVSHLSATSRRIAGVRAAALGALGPAGVLRHFAGSRMRSRR